jgi:type II secretory pathway component PulM
MRYGNEAVVYQALYNPLLWHRKRRRDYLTSYKEEQQYVGNK